MINDEEYTLPAGHVIECYYCCGKGWVNTGFEKDDFGECPRCSQGYQWLYPSGVLAQYPTGPLMGRVTKQELKEYESHHLFR